MIYQFIAFFNLGLLFFSLASYLAKINNLLEPLFVLYLAVIVCSFVAIQLENTKEVKIIAGVIILISFAGGFLGWM